MIPITDIRAWGNVVPWKNAEQIEQDLVISRSLVEIYSDKYLSENLAFRGGTALHKLFFTSQPRYSEDIDLVQKDAGPIRDIITGLRTALAFLGEPKVKQKANNNTLIFRFDSENITPIPPRLKVEVNCREHFSVLGYKESAFSVETSLKEKLVDKDFVNDTISILRPGEIYNPQEAFTIVSETFLESL